KIFVKLGRQTEPQRLERGSAIAALAQEAPQARQQAPHLSAATRERWARALRTAQAAQPQIRPPSPRLTQGKKLPHCQSGKAYDPTMAPIMKGQSNCPAPLGRTPGRISEPTAGFLLATAVPVGNPSDPRYGWALLDKVPHAIAHGRGPKTPR